MIILKLLIIALASMNLVTCQEYVNIKAYYFAGCSSNDQGNGIGYSFPVDKCITGISFQDNEANGNIKASAEGTTILIEKYSTSDTQCNGQVERSYKYHNGTCDNYDFDLIQFYDGSTFGENQHLTVSVNPEPIYRTNSLIFEQYSSGSSSCNHHSNLQYAVIVTSPFEITTNGTSKTLTYSCTGSNVPYYQKCISSGTFCSPKQYINVNCDNNQNVYCTSN